MERMKARVGMNVFLDFAGRELVYLENARLGSEDMGLLRFYPGLA
jgi:hypothetical protein